MAKQRIIARHYPLITNRVEFRRGCLTRPPTITGRTNFKSLVRSSSSKNPGPVEDVASSISSSSEEEEENFDVDAAIKNNKKIIPKPVGEVGRPRSGGYNLETTLGWPANLFSEVQSQVHIYASTQLVTSVSYKGQPAGALDKICDLANKQFPILQQYANSWPVRDLLKLHLKNTSAAHRQAKSKGTMEEATRLLRSGTSGDENREGNMHIE